MEDFQKSVLHHHRWVNIHWSLTLLVVCKKGRGIKPVSLCSILPYLIVSPFYFYVLTLAKWETWRISPGFGFWSVQAWCQYTYWADPITHISGSSSHSALLYYNSETVRGQIKRLSNHFCFYWSWNINKPVTKIELKCLLFFFSQTLPWDLWTVSLLPLLVLFDLCVLILEILVLLVTCPDVKRSGLDLYSFETINLHWHEIFMTS